MSTIATDPFPPFRLGAGEEEPVTASAPAPRGGA
jgi:hypothetical protein